MIEILAWSGGAGGSTNENAPDATLPLPHGGANIPIVNNPYLYGLKAVGQPNDPKHEHGGPIPPGRYQIYPPSHHKKFGLSCFLNPLQKLPNNRGDFFIHKQGPHGSDGCIVPAEASFEDLMTKLKASGGGSLTVEQAMDGAFA